MDPVERKQCPTCGNPYGSLPPIDVPVDIVTPDGKEVVPGTLSEKGASPPPPTITSDAAKLFPAKAPDETTIKPKTPPATATPRLTEKLEGMKNRMDDPWSHDAVGGKVTVCVLMYGNYHELHRRCLSALLTTTTPDKVDIRIACNEVCPETLAYLSDVVNDKHVAKVIINQANIKKGPAMRQLLHDEQHPIDTKWMIWFDDDSIANRDSAWLHKLMCTIVAHSNSKVGLIGAQFSWTLHQAQMTWVKSRPWYRGRAFQMANGNEAPNGNKVVFAAGGFWAANMQAIREAGVPDPEIGHNGTDYMIAEQLWQAGYGMKGWNNQKQFVFTSSVDRRGLTEYHTGMPEWAPGGVAKNGKR